MSSALHLRICAFGLIYWVKGQTRTCGETSGDYCILNWDFNSHDNNTYTRFKFGSFISMVLIIGYDPCAAELFIIVQIHGIV